MRIFDKGSGASAFSPAVRTPWRRRHGTQLCSATPLCAQPREGRGAPVTGNENHIHKHKRMCVCSFSFEIHTHTLSLSPP